MLGQLGCSALFVLVVDLARAYGTFQLLGGLHCFFAPLGSRIRHATRRVCILLALLKVAFFALTTWLLFSRGRM